MEDVRAFAQAVMDNKGLAARPRDTRAQEAFP